MGQLERLLETYELRTILEQNDIEDEEVLRMLIAEGMIDLEDYYFEDVDYVED